MSVPEHQRLLILRGARVVGMVIRSPVAAGAFLGEICIPLAGEALVAFRAPDKSFIVPLFTVSDRLLFWHPAFLLPNGARIVNRLFSCLSMRKTSLDIRGQNII